MDFNLEIIQLILYLRVVAAIKFNKNLTNMLVQTKGASDAIDTVVMGDILNSKI